MNEIVLRRATSEDMEFLFRLRTDPETVKHSFGPPPPTKESHWAWVQSHPPGFFFIAERNHIAIGTGSLRGGIISLTIAPEARGQGLAVPLLHALEEYARTQLDWRLRAEIKPENQRSIRAFEAAGYRLHHLVFEKQLT